NTGRCRSGHSETPGRRPLVRGWRFLPLNLGNALVRDAEDRARPPLFLRATSGSGARWSDTQRKPPPHGRGNQHSENRVQGSARSGNGLSLAWTTKAQRRSRIENRSSQHSSRQIRSSILDLRSSVFSVSSVPAVKKRPSSDIIVADEGPTSGPLSVPVSQHSSLFTRETITAEQLAPWTKPRGGLRSAQRGPPLALVVSQAISPWRYLRLPCP